MKNLQNGFLLDNRTYHPAIKYFIVAYLRKAEREVFGFCIFKLHKTLNSKPQAQVVNEPELKLPSLAEPKKFAKAVPEIRWILKIPHDPKCLKP